MRGLPQKQNARRADKIRLCGHLGRYKKIVKKTYIILENLLKEKNISKNKLCEACNLQRTQLNNYCKNKVSRIDFTILAKLCEFLDCTPNDILKLK